MLAKLKHIWVVRWLIYFVTRLFKTGLTYRAASLVYATLLSLVPLMIVMFTVLSVIPHSRTVAMHIEQFIFKNFVTSAASGIVDSLRGFAENVHQLSWVNWIFLFFVSMLMIHNMRCAFNTIWEVKERRNPFMLMGVYLVVLIIAPPVAAGLMVAGAAITALPYVHTFADDTWIKTEAIKLLPWLATFLLFWLLNEVLPSCKVKTSAAVIGALVTTVLFEVFKSGFTMYIKHASTYQLLYGAVAAIPIFLIWLYLSWILVLLGAMIAHLLTNGIEE